MASNKNRILEPYGYIEQVDYNMMGFCDVDLTPINDKNKEQDEEISNLSGLAQDAQNGLTTLEGKFDEFSGNTLNALSEMTVSINANAKNIRTLVTKHNQLSSKVSDMDESLSSLTDRVGTLSDSISTKLSKEEAAGLYARKDKVEELETDVDGLSASLNTKLSQEEADDVYARKDSVYTKKEVDDIVSGELSPYASRQWVEEQGYVKRTEADTLYASKNTEVNAQNALDKANDVFTDFNTFKGATNQTIGSLVGRVTDLEAKEEGDKDLLSSKIDEVSEKTNTNTSDIANLKTAMESKADKTTTDAMASTLAEVQSALASKVEISVFDDYKTSVAADIDFIKGNYAKKSDIENTNANITSLKGKLDEEIANRISGDDALTNKINKDIKPSIESLRMKDSELQIAVEQLGSDLAKETENREKGDSDLLGLASDPSDRMTLYGVKTYAASMAQRALNHAKKYTDDAEQNVTTKVNDLNTKLNNTLGSRVTKDELAAAVNDAKNSLKGDLTNEINRATAAENALKSQYNVLEGNVNAAITTTNNQVATNSTILSVITSWKPSYVGDTDYSDEGNGVLDVLHREFHNLKNFVQVSDTVEVKNDDEVALGVYNASHTGDNDSLKTIFSVGIGTSDTDRKNAFEVRRNGDIYMLIEGQNYKLNDLLAKLIDRLY